MSDLYSIPAADHSKAGYIISANPDLLDVAKIHHYLSAKSYWARGRSREQVERSIKYSLCFGVYLADTDPPLQVGFARAVTDYSTFAYLADVFLLPDYQGQGLGKRLVAAMLDHPELQSVGRWTLYTKDAHDLYRRFGFDNEQDPQRYMSYRPQSPGSASPGFKRR